jgi:hypothetical protein
MKKHFRIITQSPSETFPIAIEQFSNDRWHYVKGFKTLVDAENFIPQLTAFKPEVLRKF